MLTTNRTQQWKNRKKRKHAAVKSAHNLGHKQRKPEPKRLLAVTRSRPNLCQDGLTRTTTQNTQYSGLLGKVLCLTHRSSPTTWGLDSSTWTMLTFQGQAKHDTTSPLGLDRQVRYMLVLRPGLSYFSPLVPWRQYIFL